MAAPDGAPDPGQDTTSRALRPRDAQRRRTRRALVDATQRLLVEGVTPSIEDIAAEADVSRRTVYMHFPTLDQLILDATVGLLSSLDVDRALDSTDDAASRVEALVRALLANAPESLPLGRRIIRLTVDRPAEPGEIRRGYRRVEWIERALEPARSRLSADDFDRLVSALAVLVGWESMTVLEDIRGLQPAAQTEVLVWASRTLVQAALADAGLDRRADSSPHRPRQEMPGPGGQ